ncbi:MAG TPA: cytochrome c [Sedimenticola thiotaurini]|uniref:Cytochrome c n=1 Tax=Sedimenticola thiotaurini TaxID=1543721 RepID=A0A831RR24_9GAMM|nr:cytochrome c [Sedimenticola thiotaurini]
MERTLPRNPFILLLSLLVTLATGSALAEIPPQRQAELIYLLRHDCGSCHGMRLEGGLGPALKPDRFAGWSTEQLAATILHGRPGTPMPPWRPFFTDREAYWLAGQLKRGIRP